MNKHLGEIKLENKNVYENALIFNGYIDKLVFTFENYNLDVYQICDLALNPDKNIIIELALFNPYLYNAYVNDETINTLTEYGGYIDTSKKDKEYHYNMSYKNYRIKSASGSKSGQSWIYILEPVDE